MTLLFVTFVGIRIIAGIRDGMYKDNNLFGIPVMTGAVMFLSVCALLKAVHTGDANLYMSIAGAAIIALSVIVTYSINGIYERGRAGELAKVEGYSRMEHYLPLFAFLFTGVNWIGVICFAVVGGFANRAAFDVFLKESDWFSGSELAQVVMSAISISAFAFLQFRGLWDDTGIQSIVNHFF